MQRKIRYAGATAAPNHRTIAEGASVGPRGIALMRRALVARGPYRLDRNRDREAVEHVLVAGFVTRDRADENTVFLTESGRAFLDRLARAH
ncbi:hypothetical protein [Rhizobium leguminosarum]|uniref:hypothetical protein n=1 Tax=Rhizobium leguminosarum TaxID=384 RepID=UPI003F96297F